MGSDLTWESAIAQQARPSTDLALRLKTGRAYTMRFFSDPKRIFRCLRHDSSTIIDALPTGPNLMAGEPLIYVTRYVQLAIDRDDGDRLKVVEFNEQVFLETARLCSKRQTNPGGLVAPDIEIEVRGKGICTEYRVTLQGELKPFSEKEKDRIREGIQRGLNLDFIFRPRHTVEVR